MNQHPTPTSALRDTVPSLFSFGADGPVERKRQALIKWQGACLLLLFVILLLAFL